MPTRIEWTSETWNPITGCTPISEGCEHCYARRMANRLRGRFGYPLHKPFEPGVFHPDKMFDPYAWKKTRRVFVCSMGDLFHRAVRDQDLMRVWQTIGSLPEHTFQILTKRPERMREFVRKYPQGKNVWLGVTAENQQRADERIPILLDTPAAVRFVSVEPMLGMVWLDPWIVDLDWVICGGETGPGARYMNTVWAKDLRGQCKNAGVPFFFKKWSTSKSKVRPTTEMPRQYPEPT